MSEIQIDHEAAKSFADQAVAMIKEGDAYPDEFHKLCADCFQFVAPAYLDLHAQLAALAALVGITPETHRQFVWDTSSGTAVNVSGFPGLDTPAGDDVFLAPVMRWLARNEYEPLIIGDHVGDPCWACITKRTGDTDCGGSTFTAALIQACLAARVPEVCRAMGVEG